MLRDLVGVHIDEGCKTPPAEDDVLEQKQKQEWANLFAGAGTGTKKRKGKDRAGPDGECLPTVSYAILKEKQIRELLAEHGLPTTGDRAMLTARHMQYDSISF
ncbi:hypothetical protein EWM64_g5857 [Hericium alpestre]|uniref:SAP domain-containing protein n=1 Tax=Hericium alpestre TaxID=135208 RepID=A0A4Y9ZVS2_9AGAM|nr:hypothetical protein EWM64_g5857 [Hericium alpestre]